MIFPRTISFSQGDVNGDKIPDNVYLTGIKTPGSPFTQNITLVIQDGRTSRLTSIHLGENAGYNPVLKVISYMAAINKLFVLFKQRLFPANIVLDFYNER